MRWSSGWPLAKDLRPKMRRVVGSCRKLACAQDLISVRRFVSLKLVPFVMDMIRMYQCVLHNHWLMRLFTKNKEAVYILRLKRKFT